jgi:ferric-dicitrate binding protein FerR (iron transport regulator)
MEDKTDMGNRMAGYFLSGEREIKDPVLRRWLDESESNRHLFRRYEKIWYESGCYVEKSRFEADVAWEKINKINRQKQRLVRLWHRIYYTASGVAASILILFAVSYFGVFGSAEAISVYMKAGYGSRSDVTLPDGTVVKLNAGSAIAYSFDGKKKIREVRFEGEGFFDVSKSEIPFIIKPKDGPEIRVLGTSFNLRAYPEDRMIQTSLIEGRVELIYADERLVMKSGDMVVFDKASSQWKPVEGVLSHTYGWLDNKLYMYDMSLEDVCKYLERRYDVHITLSPELSRDIHYNGVLKEETITDAIKALSGLSKIKYHVKGKNICITPQ